MIEIHHTDNARESYNEIYQGPRIHQMDSFFIWICDFLKIKPGFKLLDVSTGRGQMVKFALKSGASATGMDFSWVACSIANNQSRGKIVCANGQFLPFISNSFDIVTNIGSLEHFDRMDLGIQEMARILKPEGKAFITVPNTFGLRWNVQIGWRTGDIDDDGQPIQRYGTRKQWENLLEANGLKVVQVLGYEHESAFPRTWRDLYQYIKHPKRLISMLLIVRFIPVNAAGQFVFLCQSNNK